MRDDEIVELDVFALANAHPELERRGVLRSEHQPDKGRRGRFRHSRPPGPAESPAGGESVGHPPVHDGGAARARRWEPSFGVREDHAYAMARIAAATRSAG